MQDKNIEMARKIAAAVDAAGGRTYYVGGYVRDRFLGRESKDIDIEIHGIPVQCLHEILDTFGNRLAMGASFGILGLQHYDLDIAMPRSEKEAGRGLKDFEAYVDPFIGEENAARRRDFTMNALMQNVLTGEVLDFFGGVEDMKRRRIRHVSSRTFAEDPLRVFRSAQFAARFGFSVAEETTEAASSIDVSALAGERILIELEKVLLKAEKPSIFFDELRKMHQLSAWFPEAEHLIGIPQNGRFHPEGDAWTHTMQVLDEAARLRGEAAKPLWFMLSALCHDFGKAAATTVNGGAVHAYGHEKAGLPLVRSFLGRITDEVNLTAYLLNMTELHMQPMQFVRDGAHMKAYMNLFDQSVCPEDLLLLVKADDMGRKGAETDADALAENSRETEAKLREMLAVYEERMKQPYLMGRDLIEAGLEPGPVFSEALAYAHKLRLNGIAKEDQLKQTLGWLQGRKAGKET